MKSQKEGTGPHFSEKPSTSSKGRPSMHAAKRYAHAEEKKDPRKAFDDTEDSDYDRVELQLYSERTRGRCEHNPNSL